MAKCVWRWRNNDTGIVIVLILRSYFVDIYITRHGVTRRLDSAAVIMPTPRLPFPSQSVDINTHYSVDNTIHKVPDNFLFLQAYELFAI